jgi:hypothetical protein
LIHTRLAGPSSRHERRESLVKTWESEEKVDRNSRLGSHAPASRQAVSRYSSTNYVVLSGSSAVLGERERTGLPPPARTTRMTVGALVFRDGRRWSHEKESPNL